MPYRTVTGDFERASRTGHVNAIVRSMADKSSFYVPADSVRDLTWLTTKVRGKTTLPVPVAADRLQGAIGVDGSLMVVPVRDGLPSVRYGYAQAAAIWLDLEAMEAQKQERFVDPVALNRAVNSALVSFDLPVAGAYVKKGVSIQDSWRITISDLFRKKRIEVNRMDQSLLSLLMLLYGGPGHPATQIEVNCPQPDCKEPAVPVRAEGVSCPSCQRPIYATDVLRIQEEVVEDGSNQEPLGRLMQVVELLVAMGLATLLWEQARHTLLRQTLFVLDGPMAVYGPPAKLRARALSYFQAMGTSTPGAGPFVCGVEKTGTFADYGANIARHDALAPGDLLLVDDEVISAITNADNPKAYGSETYWGRKFIYRALDGRVVVINVLPETGPPYDDHGGQPDPGGYPSLPAILDVIDRTGSSMYRDGIIPVALAHSKAAYPIGVGTDVLRLAALHKLGLSGADFPRPGGIH